MNVKLCVSNSNEKLFAGKRKCYFDYLQFWFSKKIRQKVLQIFCHMTYLIKTISDAWEFLEGLAGCMKWSHACGPKFAHPWSRLTALRAHWVKLYTQFQKYLKVDSGKVGSVNHTQLKFHEATLLPLQTQNNFAELFTDKSFQLDFSN